jgi:hypothetical protein
VVLHCAGIALDPGDEAPSLSVANVDIADTAGLQESLHGVFNLGCGRAFTGNNPAVFAVGFQSERKRSQFFGKALRLVIVGARFRMNEDWARRWIVIKMLKWVVGKQNAVFFACPKLLQACAARAVARGKFDMSGMAILRRLERTADLFSKCRGDW